MRKDQQKILVSCSTILRTPADNVDIRADRIGEQAPRADTVDTNSTSANDIASNALAEKAYRQHKRRLLAIAQRILHDTAEAEDVLHTVFLRCITKNKPMTAAYLCAAVRNESLRVVRDRKRQLHLTMQRVRVPCTVGAEAESKASLDMSLSHVSPAERRVVEAALRGMTIGEIARSLGRSPRTIENQLRSGRAKLRALLI